MWADYFVGSNEIFIWGKGDFGVILRVDLVIVSRMKFIGIIPSRYGSSRLPGKPLARIGDMTMVERVWRKASEAIDRVVVATDSELIAREVERFGGEAVMTDAALPNGTMRCLAAIDLLGAEADAIINIQGDEPFIDPADISRVARCFADPAVEIATLVARFDPALGYDVLSSPAKVKVTLDCEDNALMFSRAVIPFVRDCPRELWPQRTPYYIHTGLYGYRLDTLRRIAALPPSPLEAAENLEQLRWLQAGLKIKCAVTRNHPFGIDTPADLLLANNMISKC